MENLKEVVNRDKKLLDEIADLLWNLIGPGLLFLLLWLINEIV